jgi:hypothetical protein
LGPDTEVFLWEGEWCRILLDRLADVHADKEYVTAYGIRIFITCSQHLSEKYLMIKMDLVHIYKPFFRPF